MPEDLGWEIRLYTRTPPVGEFVQTDIINEYKSFQFTKVLNDAGSGSITFDWRSLTAENRNDLFLKDSLIAFCKPTKNITTPFLSQNSDIVFSILPENIEHTYGYPKDHDLIITGPGIGEMLNRAVVHPIAWPSANPDTREHAAVRPLDVWEDMRVEAVARQATIVTVTSLGVGQTIKQIDSANVPWAGATAMNLVFEIRAGTGLLELLKWAKAFGGFDFYIEVLGKNPLTLVMLAYQSPRRDASSAVGLHLGRHHLSGKRLHSRESVMSVINTNAPAGGAALSVFSAFTDLRFGRREYFWTDASNYNQTEATSLATKIINSRNTEITTITCEIAPNVDHRAFIDYDLFDTILYDNSELEIRQTFMVKGLAVRVNGEDYSETQEIMLETPLQSFTRRAYEEFNREEQRFKYNSKLLQVRRV